MAALSHRKLASNMMSLNNCHIHGYDKIDTLYKHISFKEKGNIARTIR
jgi:hypothetical protein